jgi:hypothetical protein
MIRTVQTNFTSGMLDPSVRDHVDIAAYRNGAKEIENCRILPQGGVTRRPGGLLVSEMSQEAYQIEPFVFSGTQAYAFFFYAGYVEIWNKNTRTLATTIAGPWTADHIEAHELGITQQLDKMFVSHEDFQTRVITRTGVSSFSIAEISYSLDATSVIVYQPYHKYAPNTVTLTPTATGPGTVRLETSAAYFTASHVGLKIRYRKKQCTVTAYVSATEVDATYDEPLPANVADYDWDEQAFSPIRGYPRTTGLHLQRFYIGGGRDCPNVIWASSLNDPLNFDLGTGADDDAIKYPIYADRVAEIRSLVSNVHLQIFTASAEFYVPKPTQQALTPGTFSIERQSGYGASTIPARQFDQTTIFITDKAQAVREFSFEEIRSSYAADALTFMAKSLISDPVDLDVQIEGRDQEQEARAYIINADGTIAVLTKVKKENISGWSYFTTEGTYANIAVIDTEAWYTVRREVNGTTKTFLEIFDASCLMDFSVSATDATAKTSWGPFDDHKGAEVHMRSGDLYLGTATVDATTGMVTTPTAVTEIEIGFNFTPRLALLQQQVQMPNGTTIGDAKRYVRCIAQVIDTLSVQIKNRHLGNTLPDEDPGVAPERFSGDFGVWLLGWSLRNDVEITSPYPLPFTLNSVVTEVEV